MIAVKRPGWKVIRRIGIGDREVVRGGLMQVACLFDRNVDVQVEAALAAAKLAPRTLRVYINTGRLRFKNPEALDRIHGAIMTFNRDHDLMDEEDLTRERFDWVLERCDLVVIPTGDGTKKDLQEAIQELWSKSDRNILNGNTRLLSVSQLREQFSQYYGGEDDLWGMINVW